MPRELTTSEITEIVRDILLEMIRMQNLSMITDNLILSRFKNTEKGPNAIQRVEDRHATIQNSLKSILERVEQGSKNDDA